MSTQAVHMGDVERRDDVPQDVAVAAWRRVSQTRDLRTESRRRILLGNPLNAEADIDRAAAYKRRVADGAEAIQGDHIDWVRSAFLEIGSTRARAVARVESPRASVGIGTGFLISPELFITNHHVIPDPQAAADLVLQFDYALDPARKALTPTEFAMAPDVFFVTAPEDDLDFTIIAVGKRLTGTAELASLGYLPLSDRMDKHAIGMNVNVIEHPLGQHKLVVVRDNELLARDLEAARCLHYSADTEEGSSGSPVCNDEWEVVALHHWSFPHLDRISIEGLEIPQTVNEGIRISVIVQQLRQRLPELAAAQRALLERALQLGDQLPEPPPSRHPGTPPHREPGYEGRDEDNPEGAAMSTPMIRSATDYARTPPTSNGADERPMPPPAMAIPAAVPATPAADSTTYRHTFSLPLEVTIRWAGEPVVARTPVVPQRRPVEPVAPGAERAYLDLDYSNRNGYDSEFIDGLSMPLAAIARPRRSELAPLLPGNGSDRILKYQNFGLGVCADRAMALVVATNIDGRRYISIDRTTGVAADDGSEGDTWYDDSRIDRKYTIPQSFYGDWSAYFDRGHIARRNDPTWGTEAQAIRANADTFHRTNCTPQHFRFNQSVRFWQGLERYVLEKGVLQTKQKVTVLAGPVLDDENYSKCDDVLVPLLFWKVLVRVGPDARPQVSAFVVSQERLLDETRTYIARPTDSTPIVVDPFRVSVKRLQKDTGLDFSMLEPYDTFKPGRGPEAASIKVMQSLDDAL